MPPKIATCLWFDGKAEDAARFYVSVFGGSIDAVTPYPEGTHIPADFPPGTALLVEFTLFGQAFQGLNGGPHFTFDEAISIAVTCTDQAELDRWFDALTADGGTPGPCGWVKDKYGLSWQLVPHAMIALQKSDDKAAVQRMTNAMLTMQKLDIAALEAAFKGETQ